MFDNLYNIMWKLTQSHSLKKTFYQAIFGNLAIIILGVLLNLPNLSFAQSTLQWSKSFGGSLNDIGTAIFPTSEGGCIISGYTFSINGDISQTRGGGDIWLARINSSGNIQWKKTYGGQGFDKPTAVLRAADGSIILLYNSRSADTKPNLGGTDCFVVKLSSNGNIVWLQAIGGASDDYGKVIIDDGSGGFFVAGNTLSTFDDSDMGSLPKAWLFHINNLGEVIWNKTFGGNQADFFEKIIKHNNQLIIVGNSESSTNQITNKGSKDAWLLTTDLDGNLLWSTTYGGSEKDGFKDVVIDEMENIVSVGYTFSSDFESMEHRGSKDGFIIKTNLDGHLIWSKTIGGSSVDETVAISSKKDSICIWSNTTSNNGDFETTLSQSNAVLSVLDHNGIIHSNTFFGGSKEDVIHNAVSNNSGDFFAIGYSKSNDGNVFTNKGLADFWLIKTSDSIDEAPTDVTINLGETIQICQGNAIEIDLEETCSTCSFEWEDGSNDVSKVLNPTESSTYLITMTDDTGNPSIGSIEIEVLPALEIEILETPISCKGASDGMIDLIVEGGSGVYDVIWNNGSTDENLVDLNSDIYQVTVVDVQNCTAIANTVMTNPSEISNLAVIENIQCYGEATGQILLSTNGGVSPYIYDWSNAESSNTISNLEEDTYIVTITDAVSCTKVVNYNINAPNELQIAVSIENPSNDESNGSILLIPSGGNPPYEINWNTGNTGASINDLSNGTYSYTLTDSNDCSLEESLFVGTTSNNNLTQEETILQPNPNTGTFILRRFVGQLEIYSLDGKTVYKTSILEPDTIVELPLNMAKGIYFVKCYHTNSNSFQIEKLILK